jgi:hypothetical protein
VGVVLSVGLALLLVGLALVLLLVGLIVGRGVTLGLGDALALCEGDGDEVGGHAVACALLARLLGMLLRLATPADEFIGPAVPSVLWVPPPLWELARVHGTIYRTTRMLVFDVRQDFTPTGAGILKRTFARLQQRFRHHCKVIAPALRLRFHERNFRAAFRLHVGSPRPNSSRDPHSPSGCDTFTCHYLPDRSVQPPSLSKARRI